MKQYLRLFIAICIVTISLTLSVFAESEKNYIVYPSVSVFSMENSAGFVVVGEEDLNAMLDAGMVDWYEEDVEGVLADAYTLDDYDEAYTETFPKYELDVMKTRWAWDHGYTGKNIKIAVIDSGIDTNHPEFENIADGSDYTGTGIDDTFSHGTQVSGMIAAAHNDAGIKGIAPDVTIIPLKVTNDVNVYSSTVSQAILDAVNIYDCDIINVSLTFPNSTDTLKNAIDHAVAQGVIVIAAAGNYEPADENAEYLQSEFMDIEFNIDNALSYPAAYDNVIGVGSVHRLYGFATQARRVSPFSKKNSSVYISAPGERVITTTLAENNYFTFGYGTSLACPAVAGAVALMLDANPELTPSEVSEILANSATNDGNVGYDIEYGYGIINIASAVELALSHKALAPTTVSYRVSASDEALNNAVSVSGYTIGNIGAHETNTSFTAVAAPSYSDGTYNYSFAYWTNGSNTYVSGNPTYTFTPTGSFTLRAVYDKVTDTDTQADKKVEFWNGNGVLIDTVTAQPDGTLASGAVPQNVTLTGYIFDKWLNEDRTEFNATAPLEKPSSRVVAQFTETDIVYTVVFDDVSPSQVRGKYAEKISYTATGDSFDYWTLNGKVFSFEKTIEFAIWDDITLTAVYDADTTSPSPSVILTTDENGAVFIAYSVPNGYTPVDAGLIFGISGSKPRIDSFHSKASVKRALSFGQFTSLPGSDTHTVARGYLIYSDSDGSLRIIYSD